MSIQSAKFENGSVFLSRSKLHGFRIAKMSYFAFPNACFDDQVDSTSQASASNPAAFDANAFADVMARLAYGQLFRGRVV
jgi:hypothetical protein